MFFVLTVVPSCLYYLVSLNRRVLAADDAQVPADPDLVLTHGGAQEGQDLGLDTGELPLEQTGLVDSLQELCCCSRSTHRSPALLRFLRLQAQTKNISFMIQFLISDPDVASNFVCFTQLQNRKYCYWLKIYWQFVFNLYYSRILLVF